jgi:hypothetical protein
MPPLGSGQRSETSRTTSSLSAGPLRYCSRAQVRLIVKRSTTQMGWLATSGERRSSSPRRLQGTRRGRATKSTSMPAMRGLSDNESRSRRTSSPTRSGVTRASLGGGRGVAARGSVQGGAETSLGGNYRTSILLCLSGLDLTPARAGWARTVRATRSAVVARP